MRIKKQTLQKLLQIINEELRECKEENYTPWISLQEVDKENKNKQYRFMADKSFEIYSAGIILTVLKQEFRGARKSNEDRCLRVRFHTRLLYKMCFLKLQVRKVESKPFFYREWSYFCSEEHAVAFAMAHMLEISK